MKGLILKPGKTKLGYMSKPEQRNAMNRFLHRIWYGYPMAIPKKHCQTSPEGS